MFWTDEKRLNMLGLLLENVGMDAAVRLGDPALWKQAIDERVNRCRDKAHPEPPLSPRVKGETVTSACRKTRWNS